ncbi:MAG: hypothetical protein RR295_07770 [Oscillospiraceae bacterium]
MADTIDNLQIEIESSSAAAVAHVDALSNALLRLKSATSGAAGLSAIAKSMSAIGSASDKLKSVGSAAGKMQTLANALGSFGRVPDLRSVGRQMTGLSKGVSDLSAAQFNADKINSISGILSGLSSACKLQWNPGKQLKSLADGLNALGAVSLSPEKVQSITGAMQAISGIEKATGLASTIKALEKLPEISKALETADLGKFATQMQQVADAMRPLANEMQKVSAGFAAFPIRIQKIIAGNTGLAASNQAAGNSFNFLGAGIGRGAFRLGAFYLALRRTADILSDFVAKSNDYVENLNLFTVAMGDGADEALRYAKTVQDAMGIDMSGFIRNQGMFKQIVTGFGVVEEKANTMSKGLVQIGYDISSFYNRPIEESMQKVQSGIAGELEPLRRLGYALDVATLSEIARKNGIEQSVNTMTQAQKSQLRYVAIMEQSRNVMGDMARTILTPANAMRILNEKVYQLKRAIGNALIPILIKVVPYVQAFVEVLTEAAQWIAALLGFELPKIDTSGIGEIGSVANADKDALDGATKAAKELKNATLGIDELNVIAPQEKAGGAGAASGGGGGGDLGLQLEAYDFLQGLTEKTNGIKESMRGVLALTALVGAALLARKFKDGIIVGLKAISDLLGYTLFGKIGALTASAVALSHALKFAGVIAVLATMVWRFNDLWDKSEKFRTGVERIWQVFSGAFGFARTVLSDIGTELKNMGIHLLNLLPESVKKNVITAFKNFEDWAKTLDLDFADLAITIAGIGLLFVPGGQVLGVALLAFEGITIAIRELGGISEEEWAKMGATAHTVFTAIWDYSKTSFGGIIAFVTGTFTGDWKLAFDGLKRIAGAALDLIGLLTKKVFGVNLVDVVKTWFAQHVAPWFSIEKWKGLGRNAVNGLFKGLSDIKGKINEWGKGFLRSIKDFFKSNPLSDLFRGEIGISFSGSGGSKGSGWKPKAFAMGGFPEPGQYFRAREAGAELVGTVGGRTAVANNDQIVAGIEAAVYRAMMSVAAQRTERPIVVQSNLSLDGKRVTTSVENHQRQRGVGIMSGGVMNGV